MFDISYVRNISYDCFVSIEVVFNPPILPSYLVVS